MTDQWIVVMILAGAVVLFASGRVPVGIVALGVSLSLWATDIVTLEEAMGGFGTPTIILIAALFVVAEGLDAAGVTTWMGQQVVRHAGQSRIMLTLMVMIVVAILTTAITPNGSVAAMYPLVVVLSVRFDYLPSKLLMPVAFAAHAGALLVLTGSPVTILVSESADQAGVGSIGFFEVGLVGLPLLIGTILVVLLFGDRLLPARTPKSLARDLSKLPAELKGQYIGGDEVMRFAIPSVSLLNGQQAQAIQYDTQSRLTILSVKDKKGRLLTEEKIVPGTKITLRGDRSAINDFANEYKLGEPMSGGADAPDKGLVSRQYGIAEVLITPRSEFIGDTAFPGMITESGELVIVAINRHGDETDAEEVVLQPGDSLLLQGTWEALDRHISDPNVVVVDFPDAIKRQNVALGMKAVPALVLLSGMVGLLVSGVVPAAIACLLCAIGMVMFQVVSVPQAHRSMNWTTLILVAAMIPLSDAITNTGVAETVADAILNNIGHLGPIAIMSAIFLVTAVFGQVISNTATALILIPITISLAMEGGYSPMALLMCLNVAAAAALLTPIATPANLIVMEPAGYKFTDYWKMGLAVMLVYYLVAVFLVPVFWQV